MERLYQVNRDVNAYQYETEAVENWERISINGKGDCDSYAMEKYMRLRDQGVPVEDMCIATCWTNHEHSEGSYHAVLLCKMDGVVYSLDNRFVQVQRYAWMTQYDFDYVPEYMLDDGVTKV